jgi:hypothetical protein
MGKTGCEATDTLMAEGVVGWGWVCLNTNLLDSSQTKKKGVSDQRLLPHRLGHHLTKLNLY